MTIRKTFIVFVASVTFLNFVPYTITAATESNPQELEGNDELKSNKEDEEIESDDESNSNNDKDGNNDSSNKDDVNARKDEIAATEEEIEEETDDNDDVDTDDEMVEVLSSEPENTVLKQGDEGEQVVKLQQDLFTLGFMIGKELDGVFGPNTKAEVEEFQRYFSLPVNGEADEMTLVKIEEVLSSPLRNGQRHDDAIQLKVDLATIGFHISPTPTTLYGTATDAKVREFQEYYGLRINGIADEVTLAKIAEILSSPFQNGERHEETIQLKEDLGAIGFHISNNPTTLYGSQTESAVREFQEEYDLVVNGIADEVTLTTLSELTSIPMQNGVYRDDVVTLKINLAKLGFPVSNNPTPLFGDVTERVVRDFQQYYGLTVNGIAGDATLEKINEVLNSPFRNGQRHQDTIQLKEDLSLLGYHISDNPTTLYGTSTERMVRGFQSDYNLRVNGIADSRTLAKISELVESPMKLGITRQDVVTLKINLEKLGFKVSDNPTPLYGPITEAKVREFQAYYGLVVNGVANTATLAKIDEILATPLQSGRSHNSAITLKENLSTVGFHVSDNPTPLYAATTERRVREFQAYYGLVVNGIADPRTLAKIDEVLSSPFQNGVSHNDTIKLKEDLSKLGFHISDNPTPLYGSQTESTVRAFQRYYGLRVNGIADSVTLAKINNVLNSPLRNGQRHNDAIKLKQDLSKLGFHISNNPTTLYGDSTEQAVRDFQKYYSLRENGIADQVTLAKIRSVLNSPLRNGQRHNNVIKLKNDLAKINSKYRISNNPTTLFGSSTEQVVRQFQRDYGLRVSGIADEVTLAKIADVLKNLPAKETITYFQYNLTLDEARARQAALSPPPQTDKHRWSNVFVHSSVVNIVEGVTTGNVNIRHAPNTSSTVQETASSGTTLTIIEQVNDNWYKVRYKGNDRYAHASLVRPTRVSARSTANIRAAARSNGTLLGSVSNVTHNNNGARLQIVNEVPNGGSVSGNTVWYEVRTGQWVNATQSDFMEFLDPRKNDRFQHLVLDSSTGMTASDLNKALSNRGILHGKGSAFRSAGIQHSVNEAYLISHALLETGNGTSGLATGIEVGLDSNGNPQVVTASNRSNLREIKTVHNMYGIGAVDSDPYRLGAIRAYNEGWDTVDKAIIGGAKFISDRYLSRGPNTLYKMRWNHINGPAVGPQYATDMGWAVKQVPRIKQVYDQLGDVPKHFDIVRYR